MAALSVQLCEVLGRGQDVHLLQWRDRERRRAAFSAEVAARGRLLLPHTYSPSRTAFVFCSFVCCLTISTVEKLVEVSRHSSSFMRLRGRERDGGAHKKCDTLSILQPHRAHSNHLLFSACIFARNEYHYRPRWPLIYIGGH